MLRFSTRIVFVALVSLTVAACADVPEAELPAEADEFVHDGAPSLAQQGAAPESDGVQPNATEGERSAFDRDCRYQHAVGTLQRTSDRVLSAGPSRWVLFDTQSRRALASGPSWPGAFSGGRLRAQGAVALSRGRAIVPGIVEQSGRLQKQGLLLLDARDGRVLSMLTDDPQIEQAGLSQDASYAWAVSEHALTTWSASGAELTRTSGSYRNAQILAAPGKLHILIEAQGHGVVPTNGSVQITTDKHATTPANFVAQRRWFEDGRYYVHLMDQGARFGIFKPDYALVQEIGPAPGLTFAFQGGTGEYYWGTTNNRLSFYRVRGALTDDRRPVPIQALSGFPNGKVTSGRGTVLVHDRTTALIDVRGAVPVVMPLVLPSHPEQRPTGSVNQFATDDEGRWAVAAEGMIYAGDAGDGRASRPLGCRAP